MEKQKKSVGTIALVILLLIVTIVSLVLATYAWAKYTTTLPQTSTNAVVAKWNVAGNSTNLTWSQTFSHVVESRLAPGTHGTIPVNFEVTGTEVDVDYTITLVSSNGKPTNLKFYTDSSKTTPIAATNGVAYSGRITTGGDVTMNSSNVTSNTTLVTGKKITPSIYWEWPYETGTTNEEKANNDITDTNEGIDAGTMTVVIKIDAVQVQPE